MWGKGFANSKRLQFKEDGITGLAHYIVKDRQFFKRWNGSRNLQQPEPIEHDGRVTQQDMADMAEAIESKNEWSYFELRHPGWELTEASYAKNGINKGEYVHFEMRRRRE